MPTDLRSAPPEALRAEALTIAKKDHGDRHWSRVATIVGRIAQEGHFKDYGPYETAVSWAEEELGLTRTEFVQATDLYDLMRQGEAQAPAIHFAEWAVVKKSTAALVKKVVGMGGNARQWVETLLPLGAEAARLAVDKAVGAETWVSFRVRVPAGLRTLLEGVMEVAAARHPELQVAPGTAMEVKNGFRVLEVIATEWLTQADGLQPSPEGSHAATITDAHPAL